MLTLDSDIPEELFALFERLKNEISKKAPVGVRTSERVNRLWQLPKRVVYFYHNVITHEDEAAAQPHVAALRKRIVEVIKDLPECVGARTHLASRIKTTLGRFSFRPWNQGDADLFVRYLDNPAMWEGLPEEYPNPLTQEMAQALIEASNDAPERHEVRAVEYNNEVIGQVRLQFDSTQSSDTGELSYWLAQPFWGRGLTTDFVTLFTYLCFKTHAYLDQLIARVVEGNSSSVRVLEKAGYRHDSFQCRHVRKGGQWLNNNTYRVCRPDYPEGL